MIPSPQSLLEASKEFDDTKELVGALLEIAEDEALSPTTVYYLKESAIHLEALYSEYLDVIRSIKTSTPTAMTKYRPDINKIDFSKKTAWTLEDYAYLTYLYASVYRRSKSCPEIIKDHFNVTIGKARLLHDDLQKKYEDAFIELLTSLLESRFKENA